MPHATNDMPKPTMNGDTAAAAANNSKFLTHLHTYPVVSDGLETFKSHPYGRKSLDLADSAYQRFAKPVEPYLETPYSYAKPYVARADELADSGLGHVESRFPIVKEDTGTIMDMGKGVVYWPFNVAGKGRDYVVGTWQDEYNKTNNNNKTNNGAAGFQTLLLALISTALKIASDFFQAIADFLGPKYEEGKAYAAQAQEKAEAYAEAGKEKVGEMQKVGEAKGEQAKQEAGRAKEEAQRKAQK